jgi:hypothetical protein
MTTPTTSRPTPSKPDANAIVSELMAEIRENRKAAPPPRRLPPWARSLMAFAGVAVSAWLWIAPPAALLPPPPPKIPDEQHEASARLAIILQASRIDGFVNRHGRLPNSATEAGIPYPEIRYRKLDATTYELAMDPGTGALTWRSTERRDQFVGSSRSVLGGGKR